MSFARGRAVAGEDSEEEEDDEPQPSMARSQLLTAPARGQLVSGEDDEESEEEEDAVPPREATPAAAPPKQPSPAIGKQTATGAPPAAASTSVAAEPSAVAASMSVPPSAAPSFASASSAASVGSSAGASATAASSSTAPSKPAPRKATPALSARLQRLRTHSSHLSEHCARSISATLTRCDQSLAQTSALFTATLQTVQDNSSNIKIANGNFEAALPLLQKLGECNTFAFPKAA